MLWIRHEEDRRECGRTPRLAVCHGAPLPAGMRVCWVLLGVIVLLVALPLVLLVACIWLFGLAALFLV